MTRTRRCKSTIPRAARALRPVSAAPFSASAVMSWWSMIPTTWPRPKASRSENGIQLVIRDSERRRLNDPKQSAIVVIMQRLHEADVSGTILSGDEDWCHLIIPMEYDWRRHCSTSLGWNDPRGLDDDGIPLVENGLPRDAEAAVELDDRNGELMWPERFGAKEVEAAALTFAIPIIAVSIADDTPHLQRARYQADANFALECMVTLCLAGSEAELEFCGSITDDSDRRDYQIARDYLARPSPANPLQAAGALARYRGEKLATMPALSDGHKCDDVWSARSAPTSLTSAMSVLGGMITRSIRWSNMDIGLLRRDPTAGTTAAIVIVACGAGLGA